MAVAAFFRDLSPTRANGLFLVAFLIGTTLIAASASWPSIWAGVLLPTIPVIAYSAALWVSQNRYFVSHSASIKTSPYILGFLLTLIALFNLFRLGGADLVSGTMDQDILVGQVGAALMTTIAGLVSRQFLITTDPGDAQQQKVFQSLAGELRTNATEFASAQRKLVSLIQEFVGTREELFSQEEQAFDKFLTGLERGSQTLAAVEAEYPKQLQTALSAMKKQVKTLDKAAGEAAQSVADLCAAAKIGSEGIMSTGSKVEEVLSQSVQHWDEASRGLTKTLTASAGPLTQATEEAQAFKDELKETREGLRLTVQHLQRLPEQIGEVVQKIGGESKSAHEDVSSLLSGLLQDVRAMDGVVDEVTALLSKRVERMKSNG